VAASNNPQTYRAAQTADIGTGQITDALTTATIATPSAPTVTQTAKDTNGDGTIDMGLKISLASLPSGAYAIVFQIDEYQSDNTTFVDTYYVHPRKLVGKYTGVIAGHYYRVSAAGVGFNNHEGSFSSVTTLQATGKTTAPAAPTSLSVSGLAMGFSIAYGSIPSTDQDYDHSEIAFGASASIAPADDSAIIATVNARGVTANPACRVFMPITTGTRYVYMRHVNRSGKASAWAYAGSYVVTAMDSIMIGDNVIGIGNVNSTFFSSGVVTYLTLGSVGSFAFLKNNSGAGIAAGGTTAASNLAYSSTDEQDGTGSLSGTWKAMGGCPNLAATVWLRIS
jgi:hypothetical protein